MALGAAGGVLCTETVKMRATLSPQDAAALFGAGVALVCVGIIVWLGFPNTRRPL